MARLFLLLFLCLAATAPGQSTTPGVRLDVRNIASGKQGSSGSTYYGGFWRDYLRTTRLEAEIGTFSPEPLKAKLEWYFIGKQLAGGQRIVISRGDQEITIKSGPSVRVQLASEPVRGVESRYRYYYYSSRYASGSKPDGWVVRVVSTDGKTLAMRAATGALSDFFRDPARFDELVKQAERDGKGN